MKILILTLLICCAISAFGEGDQTKVLSASGGRYVFGNINGLGANTFMLDTQTGRLWRITALPNGDDLLVPAYYLSITRKKSLVPLTEAEELQDVNEAKKATSKQEKP